MSALDANSELTPLGRILARLPVNPVLGRTLVLSTALHCGDIMTTVAAVTSFPEPWVRVGEERRFHVGKKSVIVQVQRERFHKRLSYQHRNYAGARYSDHVALLCAYQEWAYQRQRCDNDEAQLRAWCEVNESVKKRRVNCNTNAGKISQWHVVAHGVGCEASALSNYGDEWFRRELLHAAGHCQYARRRLQLGHASVSSHLRTVPKRLLAQGKEKSANNEKKRGTKRLFRFLHSRTNPPS